MTKAIPEQFQNVAISSDGVDYYSLAYYSYYKLLDEGIVTYRNKISKEKFKEILQKENIDLSDKDFRNLCSTIIGSKDSESLFGIYKERNNREYKVDLLRAEKKQMPKDDEEKFYIWVQYGDEIRGFDKDGNYCDEFNIAIEDHLEWSKSNDYGSFMTRVLSEKTETEIFGGNLQTLRDRDNLMNYVNDERKRLFEATNQEEDF